MMANSSSRLHLLKITFLFLTGSMLGNIVAMPRAAAQTSQSSPSQASQSQNTQTQTSQSQTSQSSAAPSQASQPQTSQPQSGGRKVKVNPPPDYPELARKMNIQGMARVLVTVATDGKVAGVKDLGGNPILVDALTQAVKKWKYEPADHESAVEVRFEFVQTR